MFTFWYNFPFIKSILHEILHKSTKNIFWSNWERSPTIHFDYCKLRQFSAAHSPPTSSVNISALWNDGHKSSVRTTSLHTTYRKTHVQRETTSIVSRTKRMPSQRQVPAKTFLKCTNSCICKKTRPPRNPLEKRRRIKNKQDRIVQWYTLRLYIEFLFNDVNRLFAWVDIPIQALWLTDGTKLCAWILF